MPSSDVQFFFAWVDASQTTFDPVGMARFDENVFDIAIEHTEASIPVCTLEIRNPRIGLLNPSRKYWAWLSFTINGHGPQPLFFGRLVGVPSDILSNTVKIQLIARPPDYIRQKQRVAESLKVAPNYDPIWFDVAKRDDPSAILEGWSCFYHVDRVSGLVSVSDILIGEDGTITFDPSDVFYDSVQVKLLQSPLKAVNIKAEVAWQQQYRGSFYVGSWAWPTLGSDAFVGQWPRTGESLGGGYYGGVSWAGERDPDTFFNQVATGGNGSPTTEFHYINKAIHHQMGDTMTLDWTRSGNGGALFNIKEQTGEQNPFATDPAGNPQPINRPYKLSYDMIYVKQFALDFEGKQSLATLSLVYDANRKRNERLDMTLAADVQPILIDPLVTEDTEQITKKSGDLSTPLTSLLNWDSVAGQAVSVGQLIFPDNPLVPGQTTSQICVAAGVAGTAEPTFSNIAGQTTADGSVVWASIGETQPVEGAQDWQRLARVGVGTLLLPKPIMAAPDRGSLLAPGALNNPPTGAALPIYTVMTDGNGGPGALMYEVIKSGIFGGIAGQPYYGFYDPDVQGTVETFTNPTGTTLYICVQAGTTGEHHTTFNLTPGSQTIDGSVVWQCIGPVHLPIGGWPGNTPARSYFPSERGQVSLQHLMCLARAKLRKRARAVEISFDTRFEVGAMASCRMNGRVSDVRLPGGTALGKIISIKLKANGDSGQLGASVTLGCSIGKAAPTSFAERDVPALMAFTTTGTPLYVDPGYVNDGYQLLAANLSGTIQPPPDSGLPPIPPDVGVAFQPPATPPHWPLVPPTLPPAGSPTGASSWALGPSETLGETVGYTPPVEGSTDDGLVFPISPSDVVLSSAWHGIPSTLNPNNIANVNSAVADAIANAIRGSQGQDTSSVASNVSGAISNAVMQGEGLWYELVLKPLTNGPFVAAYVVNTQNLIIPQTIDLSAASS